MKIGLAYAMNRGSPVQLGCHDTEARLLASRECHHLSAAVRFLLEKGLEYLIKHFDGGNESFVKRVMPTLPAQRR